MFSLWSLVFRDILLPSYVERQSTCQLEIDSVASCIMNKQDIKSKYGRYGCIKITFVFSCLSLPSGNFKVLVHSKERCDVPELQLLNMGHGTRIFSA